MSGKRSTSAAVAESMRNKRALWARRVAAWGRSGPDISTAPVLLITEHIVGIAYAGEKDAAQ